MLSASEQHGSSWTALLWPLALGGLMLASMEVAITLAVGLRFFLSTAELARYVLLSWASLTTWVAIGGALLHAIDKHVVRASDERTASRRLMAWTFGLCAPSLAWLLWALSEGRRVREIPGRALWVLALALVLASCIAWTAGRIRAQAFRGSERRTLMLMLALAGAGLIINGLVLRRLYPAFHLGLSAISVLLVSRAMVWWSRRPAVLLGLQRWGVAALGLACVTTPLASIWLSHAPNGRFAVQQAAPISGQWIGAWFALGGDKKPVTQIADAKSTQEVDRTHDQVGISLRGQNVLLITVDALRADRLRAYGGDGLTPQLDKLAQESVVFTRAYTPTPHTSYALASLLTGKFMRPVLDLPNASTDHRTLPEMLRRYGYRTAAFFPPAVFFVDAERFASLRRDDFGFEYRKVMFASAQDRVTQLQRYLSKAEADHPLFVWVHLFEPHEPYAPAARFARGDTAVERYDGEVAQADDGVGGLVRTFRAARPNSTVIVTADHGEEFDDHGGRFHGTTLFDEQVRVPLMWSSPNIKPYTCVAPVETVDIATTLLAALGIPRDARMRGDNLGGAMLSADDASAPKHAFADIGDSRMVTDGRHKLICHATDGECLLFDLQTDPRETRNLAHENAALVTELRAALGAFVGSIPTAEAMALADGVGWPAALARGRLGDRTVGPDLVPLLGSDKALWRSGAARACGELGFVPALQVIERLRTRDPDPRVRAESALAAFALGEAAAKQDVITIAANNDEERELRVRSALLLAKHGDAVASATLIETAVEARVSESERVAAIEALGALRVTTATDALISLLPDVRLRPNVASALGMIGGRAARRALLSALSNERYPAAREAEARALIALREPKVRTLIERYLGTDTSLPSGVSLLAQMGALSPPSARGARLVDAVAWRANGFVCDATACWPSRDGVRAADLARAQLRLPAAALRRASRVTLAIEVELPESRLTLGAESFGVPPGAQQVSFALPAIREELSLNVAATEGVKLVALAIVPQMPDVAPPPPEPVSKPTAATLPDAPH